MAAATPLRIPATGGTGRPRFGDGDYPGPVTSPRQTDPVLGVLIFIASEVMFFAGLISVFLVTRAGAAFWPPPDQPRLPVLVTGLNTALLLVSGFTVGLALRAMRGHDRARGVRWMVVTCALGALFLTIQGSEWARLIRFGLTMTSSLYGATFYLIVGAHGFHVAGALAALLFITLRAWRGRYDRDYRAVNACSVFWIFVVVLWPILYALVYFG